MVKLCGTILKPGIHGHLFCTSLQFGQRHRVLSKESEEKAFVHDDWEQGLENKETRVNPLFEVESIFLHYTWDVRTYHKNLSAPKGHDTTVFKHAVHFWSTVMSCEGLLGQLY